MGLTIKTAEDLAAERAEREAEAKRQAAKRYLAATDWMVVRQAETGKAVPENVAQKRSQARKEASSDSEVSS